jgi:hypothetical protein
LGQGGISFFFCWQRTVSNGRTGQCVLNRSGLFGAFSIELVRRFG